MFTQAAIILMNIPQKVTVVESQKCNKYDMYPKIPRLDKRATGNGNF